MVPWADKVENANEDSPLITSNTYLEELPVQNSSERLIAAQERFSVSSSVANGAPSPPANQPATSQVYTYIRATK